MERENVPPFSFIKSRNTNWNKMLSAQMMSEKRLSQKTGIERDLKRLPKGQRQRRKELV